LGSEEERGVGLEIKNSVKTVIGPAEVAKVSAGISLRTEKPMDEIRARIRMCRGNGYNRNCVGTALFIACETEEDGYVDPGWEPHKTYLKQLRKLPTPVEGCLVSWEAEKKFDYVGILHDLMLRGWESPEAEEKARSISEPERHEITPMYTYTIHMGVITSVAPLLVTHRYDFNTSVIHDQKFEDADRRFSEGLQLYHNYRPAYYLPKVLEPSHPA
jgi:hypothetical protein